MVEVKKHPILDIELMSNGQIKGRIPTSDSKGYLQVTIKGKKYRLSRLIYEAFNDCVLRPEEQIDHIDRNKKNNCVSNLRKVTNMENQYNTSKNRKFLANYNNKTYISNAISYFSRQFKLGDSNITKALNNEIKHVKGWIFIDIESNDEYKYLIDKYIDNSEKIIVLKDITDEEDIKIENNFCGRFDKVVIAKNLVTGERYMFSNVALFSREFNLIGGNVRKVLSGERKRVKNFTFENVDQHELGISINKNEIIKL